MLPRLGLRRASSSSAVPCTRDRGSGRPHRPPAPLALIRCPTRRPRLHPDSTITFLLLCRRHHVAHPESNSHLLLCRHHAGPPRIQLTVRGVACLSHPTHRAGYFPVCFSTRHSLGRGGITCTGISAGAAISATDFTMIRRLSDSKQLYCPDGLTGCLYGAKQTAHCKHVILQHSQT
jgi:hypothetical protein